MDVVAKQKNRIILLIGCIGIISLLRTIVLLWNTGLPDFGVYYHTTAFFLRGDNPYTNVFYTQFNYPTVTNVIFSPFTMFPYTMAAKVWIVASVMSFIASLVLLQRVYKFSTQVLIIVFTLVVFAFPFKFTLGMGQINLFVFLSLCFMVYNIQRRHAVYTGMTIALATMLKLFPLIFIFPLLLQKQWRAITIGVAVVSSVVLFSFIYNSEATVYFLTTILPTLLQTTGGDSYYNQSFTGMLARLDVPQPILVVMRYYIFLVAAYIMVKNRKDTMYVTTFLLTTVLLLNNFTWQHHLLLLVLPYMYLMTRVHRWYLWVSLFASYLLVAYNIPNPQVYGNTWYGNLYLSHGFFGMCMVWVTLLLLGVKKGKT